MSTPEQNNSEANEERITLNQAGKNNSAEANARNFENIEAASVYTLKAGITEYIENSDSSLYHEYYPGTETVQYNYVIERHNPYLTNFLESMSHLIKSCLGAGILGMHEGFMYAGIWTSLVAVIIMGLCVSYSMYRLVICAQKMYVKIRVPKLTYPDLAEAAVATGPLKCCRRFSKAFRYTVDLCLFLELCGTCCIYEIMIADTLQKVLETVWKSVENQNFTLRIYIIIAMVPLLVLCLIRSLKYLAPFCLIADLFVVLCIITAMYYSLAESGDIRERPAWKSIRGLLKLCGICLYSMDGVPIILAIENNMKTPQYVVNVIIYGMAIAVIAAAITGFFGYWGWGEACHTPITTHMPPETVPIILQFLLVIMLAVTFAVQFCVPFRTIWHYIGKRHLSKRAHWERFYRLAHVVVITLIALAIPDMINLMIFIGDFFLAFITFVFPALIDIMVTWNEHCPGKIRWACIQGVAMITFGITLCFGTLYTSFG